jgi:hypothetical protein
MPLCNQCGNFAKWKPEKINDKWVLQDHGCSTKKQVPDMSEKRSGGGDNLLLGIHLTQFNIDDVIREVQGGY